MLKCTSPSIKIQSLSLIYLQLNAQPFHLLFFLIGNFSFILKKMFFPWQLFPCPKGKVAQDLWLWVFSSDSTNIYGAEFQAETIWIFSLLLLKDIEG